MEKRSLSETDLVSRGSNASLNSQYVVFKTPEERKKLYEENVFPATEGSVHGFLSASEGFAFVENPLDPATWISDPSQLQIDEQTLGQLNGVVAERYRIGDLVNNDNLYVSDVHKRWYGTKLVGMAAKWFDTIFNVAESGAICKMEPLTGGSADALKKVSNDVRATHALSELVYGYNKLLSLHFIQTLDWFLFPSKDPYGTTEINQVTVQEKCDLALSDLLIMSESRMKMLWVPHLRSVIFQVLHTLELAWYTHHFQHNNLHFGCIVFQRIPETSPLHNCTLLYKRVGSSAACSDRDAWYAVTPEQHGNYLLKIRNLEHSRLDAAYSIKPAKEADEDRPQSHDANEFLRGLAYLPFNQFPGDDDKEATRDLVNNKDLFYDKYNLNLLNSEFFDKLRLDTCAIKHALAHEPTAKKHRYAVVSFPTKSDSQEVHYRAEDVEMEGMGAALRQSSLGQPAFHCGACGKPSPHLYDSKQNDLFCSKVCHQFTTLFNGKTALL